MTTYVRKLPIAVGLIFFSVSGLTSIISGAGIITALYRSGIAAVISAVFSFLFAYILFEKKAPQPEVPSELSDVAARLLEKE